MLDALQAFITRAYRQLTGVTHMSQTSASSVVQCTRRTVCFPAPPFPGHCPAHSNSIPLKAKRQTLLLTREGKQMAWHCSGAIADHGRNSAGETGPQAQATEGHHRVEVLRVVRAHAVQPFPQLRSLLRAPQQRLLAAEWWPLTATLMRPQSAAGDQAYAQHPCNPAALFAATTHVRVPPQQSEAAIKHWDCMSGLRLIGSCPVA